MDVRPETENFVQYIADGMRTLISSGVNTYNVFHTTSCTNATLHGRIHSLTRKVLFGEQKNDDP